MMIENELKAAEEGSSPIKQHAKTERKHKSPKEKPLSLSLLKILENKKGNLI